MIPISAAPSPHAPASPGYSAGARRLHWLVAAIVLAQFLVTMLMPEFHRETPPDPLITLHFSLGLLVLLLMSWRLAARLRRPVPLDMPASPPWERRAARATHIAFYLALLLAPWLGWAAASAHAVPVTFFGIVPLPDLAAAKSGWAFKAGDLHALMMWTLLGLVALHATGALVHHFVRHDGVLQRMLPRAGKPR